MVPAFIFVFVAFFGAIGVGDLPADSRYEQGQ